MKIMFPTGCCLFNLISNSFKLDYFSMPIVGVMDCLIQSRGSLRS